MTAKNTLTLNGHSVTFSDEPNLLEVIRSANIDIPTFCYHSELSIYGACRLCLVEVEGQGLVASCSIKPREGMVVLTHTEEIREIRRINLELLLANHDKDCTTCPKNGSCQLQDLSYRLGVDQVRFKCTDKTYDLDTSSPSLVRNPINACYVAIAYGPVMKSRVLV